MSVPITPAKLQAAYRLGHRVLDGSVSPAQPVLETGHGPVQACLVSVSEPERDWIVTLGTDESCVGRFWAKHRPGWPTGLALFEGKQFIYTCRPSGVWIEDSSTTNGTIVLSREEAVGFEPYTPDAKTRHRRPHPSERLPCRSLYRWVVRDGDVLSSYVAFVLCHPPTRVT